jgi:pyruvate/2-oxoglutarate dehydrogenase complex dihydrolipoamide dehydrogenase (E3) component
VTEEQTFDFLIVGGGQAGIPLAQDLAKAGRRVALAERKNLGGSCVNFGCTPTKAVIASARAAFQARRGAVFGLRVPTVEVDFPAVLDRARSILMQSRAGLRRGFETSDNPRLISGHARFTGRRGEVFRLRVGDERVSARQVVLDTGTRTLLPKVDGLDRVDYIDAGNWLDRPELPEHVIFVGGGYIALEMGQFYRRMGSRVTVIDPAEGILTGEDSEVVGLLQRLLEAEGIQFRLGSRVTRVAAGKTGVTVFLKTRGHGDSLRGSHVFVATGRKPNTDDLGLETVGVQVRKDGIVETDERLATRVPGIWAAGDVRGGPMFTHTAWDDFRVLRSQLIGNRSRTTRRVVPYAVYTDPELGRVGLTEQQARDSGAEIKIGRYLMRNNSKARELSETNGSVKVIVDAKSDLVLGAAVLSADGSELIHLFVTLMNARAPYSVLRDSIHIHPTLAEGIQSAVASLE